MKSSLVGRGRMACTGKGKLLKDLATERYQTSVRVETKDRLTRTFILEQMGQGRSIWKGVWLGCRKKIWDMMWMNTFPSPFPAYKLAIRELWEGGGGLVQACSSCLSCSFVLRLLGHKNHILSSCSLSVIQSCSGNTFLHPINDNSGKNTKKHSDGMVRRRLRGSCISHCIFIVLCSFTLLMKYWDVRTWSVFWIFPRGQRRDIRQPNFLGANWRLFRQREITWGLPMLWVIRHLLTTWIFGHRYGLYHTQGSLARIQSPPQHNGSHIQAHTDCIRLYYLFPIAISTCN